MYNIHRDFADGAWPFPGATVILLIGFSDINNNNLRDGVQIAITYNSNKIAIRNAGYVETGSSWSEWRLI